MENKGIFPLGTGLLSNLRHHHDAPGSGKVTRVLMTTTRCCANLAALEKNLYEGCVIAEAQERSLLAGTS